MYDTIIIGGGPAGLTSAIYLRRANKRVLVLEANVCGGQIVNAKDVQNYPGFNSISGSDLSEKMMNQALELGAEIKYETVLKVGEDKTVYTNNNKYKAKIIIIAVGSKNRKLKLENEERLIGKGISYCATCDGNFFKGKEVAVVGGGDTALDDILYLSDITSKVYAIVRGDSFKGKTNELSEIEKRDNVVIKFNSIVTGLEGKSSLEKIIVNESEEINVCGLFIAIGQEPNNMMFKNIIDLDENGYIITIDEVKTKHAGIYVVGDAREKVLRQLTTAVSDGALAATYAIKEME